MCTNPFRNLGGHVSIFSFCLPCKIYSEWPFKAIFSCTIIDFMLNLLLSFHRVLSCFWWFYSFWSTLNEKDVKRWLNLRPITWQWLLPALSLLSLFVYRFVCSLRIIYCRPFLFCLTSIFYYNYTIMIQKK